jgi:5-carboxymethyl-2-hydroxymuconate isomerase
MPHIIAEYSANLEDRLDVQALLGDLYRAALDTGIAEIVGFRVRAVRSEHFLVGDGSPANGFVHVTARLRRGRTVEQRKALGTALLAAADKRLEPVYASHPLNLTVEVHELDPDLTFRRNTLRERAASAA